METIYLNYLLTDDKRNISPKSVKRLLDNSYWAHDRSLEVIEKTIQNSICIGVFDEKDLVAFARVVTDKAVFAWIADVIVNEAHRGKGLGKEMIQFIQDHPDIPAHLQLLRTRDAQGLYGRYGFVKINNVMSK